MVDNQVAAQQRDRIGRMAEEHGLDAVRVGAVDVNGIWRGKRVSMDAFLDRVWRDGTHLVGGVFDLVDVADEIVCGARPSGWDRGWPDVHLVPDLATFALVPWVDRTASVICDLEEADGTPAEVSPRHVLRSVLARAEALGFAPLVGYELEFHLFAETWPSAQQKGYAGLNPLLPGTSVYNLSRLGRVEPIVGDIARHLAAAGIPVEAANTEYSPSQFEMNLCATDPLSAADQVVRFKAAVREIAEAHGAVATFMARYDAGMGSSSGHIHQSLGDAEGRHLFATPQKDKEGEDGGGGLSRLGRRYLAGLLATMADLTAVACPTVNSYKRMTAGSFAPTTVTWGIDNRTTGLRVLTGEPSATRVEYRLPGADANPYLALAAGLAGGLYGIEHELDPPPAVSGNAYDLGPEDAVRLPGSLEEAVSRLEESKLARPLLGEAFVEQFLATRRHEIAASRAAVTDWERRRYFELI